MSILRDTGLTPDAARQAEPASMRRVATSLAALQSRFTRDERGSTALVFGLMVIPCIMLVGFAVDISRVVAVKSQTQGILDNAALAGAKAVMTSSTNYDTVAQASAASYWTAHSAQVKNAIPGATTIDYSSNGSKTEFTWTMAQWVQTPFMSTGMLLSTKAPEAGAPAQCSVSGWQCQKLTIKSSSLVQASMQDKHVEMSLMLDVTGSMSGQKIVDLKLAAKDLIDIILPNSTIDAKSRIALVPFAEAVNVGTTVAPQVYGPVQSSCPNNSPGCVNFTFNQAGGGSNDWGTRQLSTSCVVARQGSDKWTDASPSSSPVDKAYLKTDGSCGLVNTSDVEVNLVTPLDADKVELKQRIDKLALSGSTAGHIGTAWAWYMLSPNWGYLYPAANRAKPYGSTVLKFAVLMTDGDYNTQYCKGAEAKDSLFPKINCNGDGANADDFAAHLCSDIKDKGITVYTVGFQTSTAAANMLRDCATSVAHFYPASDGNALRMAFRDIALKVSAIRLSK